MRAVILKSHFRSRNGKSLCHCKSKLCRSVTFQIKILECLKFLKSEKIFNLEKFSCFQLLRWLGIPKSSRSPPIQEHELRNPLLESLGLEIPVLGFAHDCSSSSVPSASGVAANYPGRIWDRSSWFVDLPIHNRHSCDVLGCFYLRYLTYLHEKSTVSVAVQSEGWCVCV